MTTPLLDHLALTVPNLGAHVNGLTGAFGMVAPLRSEHFALVVDPGSGFKLELSASDDCEVHLRHLGFRADDVDAGHAEPCRSGNGVHSGTAPTRLRQDVYVLSQAARRA